MTRTRGQRETRHYTVGACITLRENTERPVTVTQGTNRIVGNDPERIVTEALAVLNGKGKVERVPELWDG